MHLLYVTDRRVDAYLVKALREAGHVVEASGEPLDGLEMAAGGEYQAVVLDWSAPPAACAARFALAAPRSLIVVIAAAADEAERAGVLAAGADACFTQPASFIELEARLEALARLVQRVQPLGGPSVAQRAAAELVAAEQAIRLNGRSITLSAREYRVMSHMVAHAGEVVGLDRLQQQVWGETPEPRPDLVRACLSKLRRKLEAGGAGEVLRLVSGHGWVFQPPPDPDHARSQAQNENLLIRPTAQV